MVYFGALVVDRVRQLGLPAGEDSERTVRQDWRARHGMAAMAVAAMPQIESSLADGRPVVVDGLYSWAELEWLQNQLTLITVAIHADRRLRQARLASRAVRPLTPAELEARDRAEVTHLDKAAPIALADYHVVNNGSPAQLEHQLQRVLDLVAAQS